VRAAILSIGEELLRGDIIDSNAQFLARELSQLGFEVRRVAQTGDQLEPLTAEIRASLDAADLLVCSGGLGPTQDDLTRQGVAKALDEPISVDERLVEEIESRFQSLRRRMPESNRRQAEIIPSATPLRNPNGTAPGWFVRRDGKIVVTLPGPPREMQPMWTEQVLPQLESLLPGHRAVRALMTFGLGESHVEQLIEDLIGQREDVIIATYAKEAGVQVHITTVADTQDEAEVLAEETAEAIRGRLGIAVFGNGEESLSQAVGGLLDERGMTLAVMESCTGGEVANALTDTDGSSDHFLGGVVAYSRPAKERYGVDPAVMDTHGLISDATARSMAEAIRREMDADVGIGTTGIAGREVVEGKPAGTCYIAVSLNGTTESREIHRPGSRRASKQYFSQCALDLLRRQLLKGRGDRDS
jgi:nicotinamide-nucleotide amidase